MSLTLLVNQSAISALPAALNQASSALLRLIRSTSPLGDSSTQQPGHPLSQRRGGAVDSVTAAASAMTQEQDTTQQQQQQQARIRSRRRLAEQVPLLSESSIDAITTTNHPLPTLPNEAELQLRQETGSLTLVLCLTMASSVLSAAFVVFLVRCVHSSGGCKGTPCALVSRCGAAPYARSFAVADRLLLQSRDRGRGTRHCRLMQDTPLPVSVSCRSG